MLLIGRASPTGGIIFRIFGNYAIAAAEAKKVTEKSNLDWLRVIDKKRDLSVPVSTRVATGAGRPPEDFPRP